MSEKKFSRSLLRWLQKKDTVKVPRSHRVSIDLPMSASRLNRMIRLQPSRLNTVSRSLRSTEEATTAIITQMNELARKLPEYEFKKMKGVGDKIAPRLIAEIGDVRRFKNAKSLIAYAGIDAPPYQSGQFEGTNRHISKRGSRSLRKCGYEVMMALKSSKPKEDNAVYEYMLQKEAEGKNKLVKIAGLNKFLRIYYARVMELYQIKCYKFLYL